MKKALIKSIDSVENGECRVSLCGMRADLSQGIVIRICDIKSWYGIDNNGYSVSYSIKAGVLIYFDTICTATRRMVNPRFTE